MKIRSMLPIALALLASACSTASPPAPDAAFDPSALWSGPIDELAPFRHGNQYTYVVTTDGGEERVVQSRCSVAGSRIFITVTQDEAVLARTEMLMETDTLLMVTGVMPQHDIAFTYDPPLVVLESPLREGVRRERSNLVAWKPSNGEEIAKGRVELAWSAHPAPAAMEDASLEIRTVKRIDLDNGRQVMIQSKRWLAPGVGEISSSGRAGEGRVEHRELQCAEVGPQRYGDCGEPIVRTP